MKKAGPVFLTVFMAVMFSGCVLSVTPDTSETVVMNPGETQTFTIKTSGTAAYDRKFNIFDASDGLSSDTIEEANFGCTTDDDTLTDTATYTPDTESAGAYRVWFGLSFWSESGPLEMASLAYANAIHSRTWRVVVRGVAVSPRQNTAIRPGATLTFTARAYPEGEYTYQWLQDDTIVADGAAYDFSPTPGLSGPHTLTVKAGGEGRNYSLTREIPVAVN